MNLTAIKKKMKKVATRCQRYLLHRGLLLDKENFSVWEEMGYHITPVHFYYPIPDTRELDETILNRRTELRGINITVEAQVQLLACFEQKFKQEYDAIPRDKTAIPYEYHINNGAFGSVDGEIAYCMVRHYGPQRIFEVGSGYSTRLLARASLENGKASRPTRLYAFEPYPGPLLRSGFPGLSELYETKIQDVPLSKFDELQENDILFIDSSHVLKTGSDVQYEYLEILPRLRRGVIVHVHDIFLPAEYPEGFLKKEHLFWNEQYLLQAFLQFNDSFEILWAGSYMHLKNPHRLLAAFKSYDPETVRPGSFWMRKVK
jgi:hypothetical protein